MAMEQFITISLDCVIADLFYVVVIIIINDSQIIVTLS